MGEAQEVKEFICPPIEVDKLVKLLLDQHWHKYCKIVTGPLPDTEVDKFKIRVMVKFDNGVNNPRYLRYSEGPKQGYFWDLYGDDMLCAELAIFALSKAPAPVKIFITQISI